MCKVIISHDVDHITVFEHYKDLIIPKFLIKSTIEKLIGVITWKEYFLRYKRIFENKWQNINELMEFNKKNNIPTTFFLGMNNGMYLSYSLKEAILWVNKIKQKEFDVGVHGIEFKDFDIMKKEYENLYSIIKDDIGIRMHYLRYDENTFNNLSKIGYLFDSTYLKDINPFKIGKMWEFPLHIMDGHIFYEDARYTTKSLVYYKEKTIKRLNELKNKNINYITILFHDRYFDDSFRIWKEWYIWLIKYLKNNNYTFISYKKAIQELEEKR
jgi:hypothetical protein